MAMCKHRLHRDPLLGRRWTSLRYKAWGEQRSSGGGHLTSYKPQSLAAQPETAVMALPAGAVTRTYYYAGGQRVAMRENGTLFYLLGDHLGSTAYTANSSGTRVAELRYKAWGETRFAEDMACQTGPGGKVR